MIIEAHAFNRLGSAKTFIEFRAITDIFQLQLGICTPLSGFYMLSFHNGPQTFFMFNHVPRTNFVTIYFHERPLFVLINLTFLYHCKALESKFYKIDRDPSLRGASREARWRRGNPVK